MPRLTLLVLLAWLGLPSLAAAQGHLDRPDSALPPPPLPPHPLPRDPALPPQPVALPPEAYSSDNWQYVAPAAATAEMKEAPADRLHHLREAADHLEAAGLVEQAIGLRKQAAELASVLAEKLEQLKKLQAEIDRLSQARPSTSAPQILLKVQIVRVLPHELPDDNEGALFARVVSPSRDPVMTAPSPGAMESAVSKLCQAGAIKLLAEPVLLTASGRAASFRVGQERPAAPVGKDPSAVEFKKAGIQVDLLPVSCDGMIRLEVRTRITTFDETGAVKIGDHRVPRMRTRDIDTGIEVRSGQTVIVGCQPPAAAKDEGQTDTAADEKTEQDIVILVTPTLESETAPAPHVPHGPTAEKPRRSWWDQWRRK